MNKSEIREHMEVVGSDGQHVGTVDAVEKNAIKLTKRDSAAGGQHHTIPIDWVASTDGTIRLNRSAQEAMAEWQKGASSGSGI